MPPDGFSKTRPKQKMKSWFATAPTGDCTLTARRHERNQPNLNQCIFQFRESTWKSSDSRFGIDASWLCVASIRNVATICLFWGLALLDTHSCVASVLGNGLHLLFLNPKPWRPTKRRFWWASVRSVLSFLLSVCPNIHESMGIVPARIPSACFPEEENPPALPKNYKAIAYLVHNHPKFRSKGTKDNETQRQGTKERNARGPRTTKRNAKGPRNNET